MIGWDSTPCACATTCQQLSEGREVVNWLWEKIFDADWLWREIIVTDWLWRGLVEVVWKELSYSLCLKVVVEVESCEKGYWRLLVGGVNDCGGNW